MYEKDNLFKDTHQGQAAPSHIIEAWITESEEDKAYTEYGLDLQEVKLGSLIVHSQVTDREYWNKEIKGNKKYAYSIEAVINLTIINLSKMEEQKLVLPDGEHLINGTIYVVKDGVPVATKEVTEQQEEVIEEVIEEAVEEAPVPVEELSEEPAVEEVQMQEEPKVEVVTMEMIEALEAKYNEVVEELAKMKASAEAPAEEVVEVQMSREPLWRTVARAASNKMR